MCVSSSLWLGLIFVLIARPRCRPKLARPAAIPDRIRAAADLAFPFLNGTKRTREKAELQSIEGMLRRIQKDQVVVEADDHRILNFKRTSSTNFLKMGEPHQAGGIAAGRSDRSRGQRGRRRLPDGGQRHVAAGRDGQGSRHMAPSRWRPRWPSVPTTMNVPCSTPRSASRNRESPKASTRAARAAPLHNPGPHSLRKPRTTIQTRPI